MRAPARLLVAALLGGALAACGGSSAPSAPKVLHAAPEPAMAPVPTTAPVGKVLELGGGRPEGIVADPKSGLVVVALREPDRLVFVDPVAEKVVKTVPVPGSARHLELVQGGGAVYVPGEDTALVSVVTVPGGVVTSRVKVLQQPHDLAVTTTGDLYVADEFGMAVSEIRDGAVVKTFPELVQPGGAAGTGDTGTVVDVRSRLLHVYRGDQEIGALPAGAGPTHALALQQGQVLVTDTSGGALIRYDVSGAAPKQVESLPFPDRPYGTAYDAIRQRIYITATGSNTLVQLRLSGGKMQEVASYPTVQNAYCVAVDEKSGRLVVAGESGSELQFIDP